jgi:hypothetical protein
MVNIKSEDVRKELASEGYDVWTIEMTGGPQIECSDCPDYTYQDLVDYYWPALVAGAIEYSGKNQVDYVGHSNGCRAALSSLNSYSNGKNNAGYVFNSQTGQYDTLVDLPNLPVDKFFGIACPGTTNDETHYTRLQRTSLPNSNELSGNYAMRKINKSNKLHITKHDYLVGLSQYTADLPTELLRMKSLFETGKISRNLMQFYSDLGTYSDSSIDLNSISISAIYLHNGKPTDFVVGYDDQQRIFDSTSTPIEESHSYLIETHSGLMNNDRLKKDVKEVLE